MAKVVISVVSSGKLSPFTQKTLQSRLSRPKTKLKFDSETQRLAPARTTSGLCCVEVQPSRQFLSIYQISGSHLGRGSRCSVFYLFSDRL